MAGLRIVQGSVSSRAWSDVDKTALRNRLIQALENNENGAREAIREVYAVIKSSDLAEVPSDNWWGPHHEVRPSGEVVLNRAGLIAAAAALAGARADPDLTDEQKETARQHLLRHYRELELEPPESLTGEIDRPQELLGEMAAEVAMGQIPMSDSARQSVEKLIEGDDNPCFVAVEIEEGKGGHGNYLASALESIVRQVNSDEPMGYAGHQKPEDVPYQFPDPTTHWLAAEMVHRGGKAVARVYGLIDKAFPDLRRWVRARRIKQVSIFGQPVYRAGTRDVVDYKLLSIDWTPRNRAGMTTRLLWASEMMGGRMAGELDGSYDELRNAVEAAARRELESDGFVWVARLFPDYVIIEHDPRSNQERKLYRFDYRQDGDTVILSNRTEVAERREYIPVGEQGIGKGDDTMTLAEMLAAIRSAIAKKETDFFTVLGEIGVTKEQAIEMLAGEQIRKLRASAELEVKLTQALGFGDQMTVEEAVKTAGEMAGVWKALGFTLGQRVEGAQTVAAEMKAVWDALGFGTEKPDDPAAVAGEMVKVYGESRKSAQMEMIDKCLGEKVTGEQARAIIKRMLRVPEGATKEQINGEIDALLADDVVKGLIGSHFVDTSPGTGGSGGATQPRRNLRIKKVAV